MQEVLHTREPCRHTQHASWAALCSPRQHQSIHLPLLGIVFANLPRFRCEGASIPQATVETHAFTPLRLPLWTVYELLHQLTASQRREQGLQSKPRVILLLRWPQVHRRPSDATLPSSGVRFFLPYSVLPFLFTCKRSYSPQYFAAACDRLLQYPKQLHSDTT